MKKKRLTIFEAIDRYAKYNEQKLIDAFGELGKAKFELEGISDLPPDHFRNYAEARDLFNYTLEKLIDEDHANLAKAKKDAWNRDDWGDQRHLNNKMDPYKVKKAGISLGMINGSPAELLQYYTVKNTGYILAEIAIYPNPKTEYTHWEYLERDNVPGLPSEDEEAEAEKAAAAEKEAANG